MDNHHLKLDPGKSELILFPTLTCPSLGDTPLMPNPHARNLGVVIVPLREHCSSDPVMQTRPLQHPENLRLLHPLLNPAPGPSDGFVPLGLLQLPLGWPSSICDQTPPNYPECSSSSGLQPSQTLPRHPPAHFHPLASVC